MTSRAAARPDIVDANSRAHLDNVAWRRHGPVVRDDLHVGAPLRQCWRNLLKVVPRNADYATEGPRRAVLGLVDDFRRDVRPTFLNDVEKGARTPQRNLDGVPEGLDRIVPWSDLECDFLVHAKRSARSGDDASQVARRALDQTLAGMRAARGRELDAVTAAKHRTQGDLLECRRRFTHSLSQEVGDEAARTIRTRARLQRAAPPLDLDMDLSR